MDEGIEWIEKVFQISPLAPEAGILIKEFNELQR
jgi:hypothetical protein